ncbi:hypothetical protein CQW23_11356 [Capsicum baccatum]|uniref:Phospholipase D C-terminal domain-containing protein n=1 Tax=Capsicum baccatum TaxID=33114 RepID=A0A2G2WPH8_CAPBA|nr:hypothetical protein CQW23_11356 [Capsicum baccatum]
MRVFGEHNWLQYTTDEVTEMKGHLLKYPIEIDRTGKVKLLHESIIFDEEGLHGWNVERVCRRYRCGGGVEAVSRLLDVRRRGERRRLEDGGWSGGVKAWLAVSVDGGTTGGVVRRWRTRREGGWPSEQRLDSLGVGAGDTYGGERKGDGEGCSPEMAAWRRGLGAEGVVLVVDW